MKNHRFQWKYRNSASKLHCTVGDCLRTSPLLQNHEIYQEYPVNRVNTTYKESSHHFDWVIPGLRVVIECHGKQHNEPVAFDGNYENAIESFYTLQKRDQLKKVAALNAGYRYIEIQYNEIKEISEKFIMDKLDIANLELEQYNIYYRETEEVEDGLVDVLAKERKNWAREKRREFLSSEKHRRDLEKARDLRRRRYREFKERSKDG